MTQEQIDEKIKELQEIQQAAIESIVAAGLVNPLTKQEISSLLGPETGDETVSQN